MKLSMWMIANQLTGLDIELNIGNYDPIILKSARRVYATNCVHIFQSDNDVICNGEGNYIRIKDINIIQAFEIVQSVFDFYEDWIDNIIENCKNMDFDSLVNICWKIFKNPILILDANHKVISMSKQYDEHEISNEWYHLKKYGYSSPKLVKFLKRESPTKYKFDGIKSKFYQFKFDDIINTWISIPIYFDLIYYGRISIIEKDRLLNKGDIQLLDYLLKIIEPYIRDFFKNKAINERKNIFLSLIDDENIDSDILNKQLEYSNWSIKDPFIVFVLKPKSYILQDLFVIYEEEIKSKLSNIYVFIKNKNIIIIYNDKSKSYTYILEEIKKLCENYLMEFGVSLPCMDLYKLNVFYNQALYALSCENTDSKNQIIHLFYDHALEYIIENNITTQAKLFCHPDVIKLYFLDKDNNKDRLITLYSYLINERSMAKTSIHLYIHRNTLVYRIKKITEMLKYDINEPYTRSYMMISIKLLDCYRKKYDNYK